MAKKIIDGKIVSVKDAQGAYLPISKEPEPVEVPVSVDDVALDDIGRRIVTALNRATKTLLANITAGSVDRDTIGALKDCSMMLKDLKKEESDYLSNASEEQLEKLLTK